MQHFFNRFRFFTILAVLVFTAGEATAAATDPLTRILKKIDGVICSQPNKIQQFYSKNLVIISDDKRALLENRIGAYQDMIAELEEIKCKINRTVLSGNMDSNIGYVLVDEQISISSRLSTDDRQHNVCTYIFGKEGSEWKITQEHCSSLPDYNIVPGDDALYYYHNPVY